jgi:hypothetical protein
VRQHPRSNTGGNDGRQLRARASTAIATAANPPAIGFDLDLDDVGVFLVTARRERLATARATGLLGCQDALFADNG